ncbi:MAG TPA: RNase adapter RapZ [Candidatus Avipropionibacterium avicola]|uniref:RNase adapter RapZ n=1 Tax=Candidatus Avipropionibacterium avicola TaxID=2840701 RepID=A0A9D1GXC6_9ACTN|nr:RNase adapter RapZ [Candidatus Avipropionibacterium avicola]
MNTTRPPAPSDDPSFRVAVVTGMTGAGRTTAANTLEDLGWYVVDNLPPRLVPTLCGLVERSEMSRLAVVVDCRSKRFFEQLPTMFAELGEAGVRHDILYVEASDEIIVRRQESVRRPHPLQGDGRLLDGIMAERQMLASVRAAADLVIDTTALNVHQLRDRVSHAFAGESLDQLRVTVLSFGFKHGIPVDADLTLDVRFLPNPHWIPELRPHSGQDAPVADYVLAQPEAGAFLDRLAELVAIMKEGYLREGKRFATVAIGCTGGRHRSVAMVEDFAQRLSASGIATRVMHRDIDRT